MLSFFFHLSLLLWSCVPPSIVTQPVGADLCEGEEVTLSVEIDWLEPPVSFDWYRDHQLLSTSDLDWITVREAGAYYVVVTDSCGAVTSEETEVAVFQRGTGDLNADGQVDGQDIPLFLLSVRGRGWASINCAADMNHDGSVGPSDVEGFVGKLLEGV